MSTNRPSRRPLWWLSCLLVGGLLLACSSDDDDKADADPVGPGPSDNGDNPVGSLDTAVFAQINSAIEQAVGLLFLGGGTVPGDGGGQIVVDGSTFTFDQFSPDGTLELDGQLTMNLLAAPITVTGTIDFLGAGEDGDEGGQMIVDMTLDATTSPPTYGGTVTIGDEVLNVQDLLAASE